MSVFDSQHHFEKEEHWISFSDLMAGLMMMFLFIAIALMRNAFQERDKIKQVAIAYQENQVAIYDALMQEFEADLKNWDAVIDQNSLTFTFQSPEVLFKTGKINLSTEYKLLLSNFFPRYIQVLQKFKSSINEIRIEGHTSSEWNTRTDDTQAYFLNMELSQGRTRSVLDYVYQLEEVKVEQRWIKEIFAAVGFSSAKTILFASGEEDALHSQRVTFRVVTNADIQMRKILDMEQ